MVMDEFDLARYLFYQGFTPYKIWMYFGLNRSNVYHWAKTGFIKKVKIVFIEHSKEKIKKIQREYNHGKSIRQISKEYHLSTYTLHVWKTNKIIKTRNPKEASSLSRKLGRYKLTKKGREKLREIGMRAAKQNKCDTKPELIFEKKLKEDNLTYEKQKRIGKYLVDFFIPQTNTIIEIYGDYWHCNPKIYDYPKTKPQKRNIRIDTEKRKFFKDKGYNFLMFWESDLKV